MLHRAIVGSLERFIGILIEHYAGALPLWLAPLQAVVLTITDRQAADAERVAGAVRAAGFRHAADLRHAEITYNIRVNNLPNMADRLSAGAHALGGNSVTLRNLGRAAPG